jgi:hypothetical protein
MISAIEVSGARYFRGHDSGDFFNVAYVEAWVEVCRALPHVKFWFPTREYQTKAAGLFQIISENPRMTAIRTLAALPNVTVRPSALEISERPPVVSGLAKGSAVDYKNVFQCPAARQGGFCNECRHCWDNPTQAVSYPLH